MKTPRVTDFDPDAKVPVLKSSLDQMPSIEKPKAIQHFPSPMQHSSQVASQDGNKRIKKFTKPASTMPLPPKRSYIRRTFDFYDDQIAYLTQQSLQERLSGKEGSMNAMVREAIDDWIKKRTSGK